MLTSNEILHAYAELSTRTFPDGNELNTERLHQITFWLPTLGLMGVTKTHRSTRI